MTPVKRQNVQAHQRRFEIMMRALSRDPSPLSVVDLVTLLREEGHKLSPLTPKKWPQRGIPARWCLWISELPRAREVGLTATWLRDGTGKPPVRGAITPPSMQAYPVNLSHANRAQLASELAAEITRLIDSYPEIPAPYLIEILESIAVWLYGHGFQRAAQDAGHVSRNLKRKMGEMVNGRQNGS